MSAQLPSLSGAQQQARFLVLQEGSLQPVSFLLYGTVSGANFATSAYGGSYVTSSFTPPTTLGIMAVGMTIQQLFPANAPSWAVAIQLSYNSALNFGHASSNLPIVEEGNIIKTFFYGRSRNTATDNSVPAPNLYSRFPGDYYVPANTKIYCHFWMEAAGITAANSVVYATATLHTAQTNIKS